MSKLSGLHRRARTPVVIDANNPFGMAQCQGCSIWVHNKDLAKRMDYRGGSSPVWTGLWVCTLCLDVPNAQFARPKVYRDPIALPHPFIGSGWTVPGSTNSDSGYGYLVDQNGNYISATPRIDGGLSPLITEIAGLPNKEWP